MSRPPTTSPLIRLTISSIHGTGVCASQKIAKGTRIIEYVGERISKKQAEQRVEQSLHDHRNNRTKGAVYIFELNQRHDIDGNVAYNTARFINHSCDPNCEVEIIRGKIWIIALKDIDEGQELLYNYGYDLEDYDEHPCRCGAKQCVGYILAEEHWPKLKVMAKSLDRSIEKPQA